jgi:hypothetical protein
MGDIEKVIRYTIKAKPDGSIASAIGAASAQIARLDGMTVAQAREANAPSVAKIADAEASRKSALAVVSCKGAADHGSGGCKAGRKCQSVSILTRPVDSMRQTPRTVPAYVTRMFQSSPGP